MIFLPLTLLINFPLIMHKPMGKYYRQLTTSRLKTLLKLIAQVDIFCSKNIVLLWILIRLRIPGTHFCLGSIVLRKSQHTVKSKKKTYFQFFHFISYTNICFFIVTEKKLGINLCDLSPGVMQKCGIRIRIDNYKRTADIRHTLSIWTWPDNILYFHDSQCEHHPTGLWRIPIQRPSW